MSGEWRPEDGDRNPAEDMGNLGYGASSRRGSEEGRRSRHPSLPPPPPRKNGEQRMSDGLCRVDSLQDLMTEVKRDTDLLKAASPPGTGGPRKISSTCISPLPIPISACGVVHHEAPMPVGSPPAPSSADAPAAPNAAYDNFMQRISPTSEQKLQATFMRLQSETRVSPERKMTIPGGAPPDPSEVMRGRTMSGMPHPHPATLSSILPRNFAQHPFEEQDLFSNQWASKHVKTESLVPKHAFKAKISKYQSYLDRAFALLSIASEDAIIEGETVIAKVMTRSWLVPRIGHELAYALSDYLRDTGNFETTIQHFIHPDSSEAVRMAAGRALEECMSARNRCFVVQRGYLDAIIMRAKQFAQRMQTNEHFAQDSMRCSISLMESLYKTSAETCLRIIDLSALDHIIEAIKVGTFNSVHKHAALALANLAMYSDNDCQKKMISKKVQDWLFLLASLQDDITRYYACLAICMLVSNKEIEKEVIKSGTLALVEPFLLLHPPDHFALSDYRHSQGRPKEWLMKLVPMLRAARREARSLAAYHFAMEAAIKKEQENMKVFQEIKAVEALKEVASSPDEVPAKFARMALKIIGEEVPYKLSHQVPLWSIEDVHYWVSKIGFKEYAKAFEEQMVDGDLLLLLTDAELERDIGMKSGLLRKRFQRELDSLKVAADYGCVDESQMDRMLMSINPELSIYTYRLLELGFDTNSLSMVTDDILRELVGIVNPVHRSKILHISQECAHIEDMEMEILRKHIEVFISYRRSSGSQLASLIKVLLQLRGRKVFIDVDRLYAGKFDASLLKNIQAASHFILVLSPNAMDRCLDDPDCDDWVHKEIRCALEHNRNIIPIFDPGFDWPDESRIPPDIRAITRFNGVRWVHEYQEACVDKLERFLNGEISTDHNPTPVVQPATPRGGALSPWGRKPSSPPQHRRSKASLPLAVADGTSLRTRSQSHADMERADRKGRAEEKRAL